MQQHLSALVSVIVPTKNSARFLSECLESIRCQTYKPIEIIVVDNHSTDPTVEIAHRFTPRIFTVGPERSAQVNFGVEQALGEYVYKVDSDFVLDPSVVQSCVMEIAAGYDAVVVHNSPDYQVSWIARIRKFEVDMYKYDITYSSARFVKRRVFEEVGGFNVNITAGEDYDFQARIDKAGYKTGFVSAEALHLGEPTSFWAHMRKYYWYGTDFVNYTNRNPVVARKHLSFFRHAYIRNWRKFIGHPARGMAFVAYSACKFAFGGAGYLMARLGAHRDRNWL